jgi:hypothetical protein
VTTPAVAGNRSPNWAPPLSWFPKAIKQPSNAFASIGIGWLLTFPASILLSVLLHWVAPNAKGPEFPITGPMAVFLLVVFSPVLETLIMGGVLLLLLRFVPRTWAVLISAIGWGIAHSTAAPIWGLVIWWPFLIFSTLFVAWRSRSLALAFLIPMVTHGLQNLGPALLVATGKAI